MKIKFVSRNFVYPMGGFEEHIYQISKGLIKKKYNIEIITTELFSSNKKEEILNKIPIKRCKIKFNLSGFCYSKELKKILDEIEANIFHIQGYGSYPIEIGVSIAKKRKIPSVLTPISIFHKQHDFPRNIIKFAYNILRKKSVLTKPDALVALTNKQYNEFKKCNKNIFRIPIGIDPKHFSKSKINFKEKYGIEGPLLMTLGRIEKYKGFETIIRGLLNVVISYPQIKLLIAGRYTEHINYLKNLAEKLKLDKNIIFINNISDEDKISAYNSADLFILSSLKEGFGIVLLESLICGTPVISTPVGIAPDLNTWFCKLFNFNDSLQLSELIIKSLDNNWKKMIKNKSKRYTEENFSWEKIIEKHQEMYEKIQK